MAKQTLIILAIVLVFGVLVPWYRGLGFLDPVTIVVYACMSLLFVAPTAAEAFAVPASRPSAAEILPRIGVILAYGMGASVIMLVSGWLTVNLVYMHGRMLTPPSRLLASALLLGVTASLATICGTALMARHFGSRTTKNVLRIIFLLLLLTWRLTADSHLTSSGIQRLALLASGVFALTAVILLRVLMRLLQRPVQQA